MNALAQLLHDESLVATAAAALYAVTVTVVCLTAVLAPGAEPAGTPGRL
ncbi:hypothetical protein QMK19_17900 [Streptomyces sp. H10-C2]|nr:MULTISPECIES: hypothetical protein [unclassified Streptomyces]MDJ0343426.1 hypothetical protein [Streptomyces sp. PH10-H1]MDJ0371506.1 hypothetical protein [Streptomyces sp. H10-C2]